MVESTGITEDTTELGPDKRPVRTRPIEKDIDEVFERIYQSGQAAAASLETCQENGITHILRVTNVDTPQHPNIKYLIYDKLWDDSEQNVLPQFTEANVFIKNALTENQTNKVLIHCTRGISRSASFACAYMIAEGGLSLMEALATGQLNKEEFQPNKNFMGQLKTFETMFFKPNQVSNESEKVVEEMGGQHLAELMRQLTNPGSENDPAEAGK